MSDEKAGFKGEGCGVPEVSEFRVENQGLFPGQPREAAATGSPHAGFPSNPNSYPYSYSSSNPYPYSSPNPYPYSSPYPQSAPPYLSAAQPASTHTCARYLLIAAGVLVVTVIPAMIIGPLVKVALFGESQGMAALIDGMGASIIGAFVAGLIALGVGFAGMLCNRKRLSNPPFQMALYWVIALATPIALWIMQFVSLLPGVLFAAVR